MFKNKKVIVISLSAVLLLAIAVVSISFFLSKKDKVEVKDVALAEDTTNAGNYVTNIDRIIQNAENAALVSSGKDIYTIIQIVPNGCKTVNTPLEIYIDNATTGFATKVVKENKTISTIGSTYTNSKIKIYTYNITELQDLIDSANSQPGSAGNSVGILNDADLIYLSCDPTNTYGGSNDLPEIVYNFLKTYTVGKNKPIMCDYVTNVTTKPVTQSNVVTLCTNSLYKNIYTKNTHPWSGEWTADTFLKYLTDRKFSMYATSKYDNTLSNGDLTGTTFKILVIAPDTTDYNSIIVPQTFMTNGFYKPTTNLPSAITVTSVKASSLTVAGLQYDNAGTPTNYNMYFIAPGDYSTSDITTAVSTQLATLSNSDAHIIYASDLRSVSSTTTATTSNFVKFIDFVFTSTGTSKYTNVLKTDYAYFNAVDATEVKSIVQLINSSTFRDYGGAGAKSGKKYMVLEIEPCYPIDTTLAATKTKPGSYIFGAVSALSGNYYTVPADVVSGVTKDELPQSGGNPTVEYYDFDISKAKIAKATGIPYDQIELVQMSTEELIGSKEVISETYDLVYVGGNMTALRPAKYSGFAKTWYGENTDKFLNNGATGFTMYTHTGDFNLLESASNGTFGSSNAIGKVKYNGSYVNTVVTLNGNDLNSLKCQELIDYMNAGFPIMFGDNVSGAYNELLGKSRLQMLKDYHLLDPDSFMYDVLSAAYTAYDKGATNIYWGLPITSENTTPTRIANTDKKYGNTVTTDVEVFSTATNTAISDLINASKMRTAFSITSCPLEYIEGDTTTYNDYDDTIGMNFTFNTSIAGNYTVELYIDEDGNGLFKNVTDGAGVVTLTELKASTKIVAGTGGTIKIDSTSGFGDPDFYGIKSWKLVLRDTATNTVLSYYTGYAKYNRKDTVEKREVRILQIMPSGKTLADTDSADGYGNEKSTLYLCTECQKANYILKGNIWDYGDPYWNTLSCTSSKYPGNSNVVPTLGLHENKFGIVKYNSVTGEEDWNSNFADPLLEDYEFKLDIMYSKDFEALVAAIKVQTAADDAKIAADTTGNTTRESLQEARMVAVNTAYSDYLTAETALTNSGAEAKLVAKARKIMASTDSGFDTTDWEEYISEQKYYMFYYNASTNRKYLSQKDKYELYTEFNAYTALKDVAITKYNTYNSLLQKAYYSNTWLYNNYDMVVLGFATDFGNTDLNLDACSDVSAYEEAGGNMLATHDAVSMWDDLGSVNIAKNLSDNFGMNRFHASVDTSGVYYTSTDYKFGVPSFNFGTGGQAVAFDTAAISMSNKNATLDIQTGAWSYGGGSFVSPSSSNYGIQNLTTSDTAANMTISVRVLNPIGGLAPNGTVITLKKVVTSSSTTDVATATTNNGIATFTLPKVVAPAPVLAKHKTTDPSKFFWTEFSSDENPVSYVTKHASYLSGSIYGSANQGYLSTFGVTDAMAIFNTSYNSSPYLYVEYDYQKANSYAAGSQMQITGTSRASQINSGILTTYPFYISSELDIANTHAQSLALDMEDENMMVWYALSGSGVTSAKDKTKDKKYSSLFAASPRDAMDSYFIYSNNNITYCGAGHLRVTGKGRDNNDERRLLINVIVNSVRNAKAKPKITLYDPEVTDLNKPVPQSNGPIQIAADGSFEYTVNSKSAYPGFGYAVSVDSTATVSEVKIYYDLNYGVAGDYSNNYTADANHVLIKSLNGASVSTTAVNTIVKKDFTDAGVVPANMFVAAYNGEYTYIVVMVKDSLGQVSYQRIKIVKSLQLFDLTLNTDSNGVLQDAIVEYKKNI